MVRVAQKANVRAHVVVTAQTKLAVIAVKGRLKCPSVAGKESTNTEARFHDPSCWLMPEDHRVDIWSAADTALGVGVQIAPADAYGLDPHLPFAPSRIFNRHVSNPECPGSDECRSLHRMLFLEANTLSVGGTNRTAPACSPA